MRAGSPVSFWTGASQGQPIGVDQPKVALTPDMFRKSPRTPNLSPDSALAHLAEHLPKLAGNQA